jgi:hypothetical protein
VTDPLASGKDGAPVSLDDEFDQPKSDPQPRRRSIAGRITSDKNAENPGHQGGVDPDPFIPDGEDDLGSAGMGRDRDRLARVGIAAGVGEQVDQDLLHSRRIGFDPHRILTDLEHNRLLRLFQERSGRIDRRSNEVGEGGGPKVECERPLRDPREVQQIIDQQCELASLVADDPDGPLALLLVIVQVHQQLAGVIDRRERISQLMAERREEFILGTVCVSEGLLGLSKVFQFATGLEQGLGEESERLLGRLETIGRGLGPPPEPKQHPDHEDQDSPDDEGPLVLRKDGHPARRLHPEDAEGQDQHGSQQRGAPPQESHEPPGGSKALPAGSSGAVRRGHDRDLRSS